MVFHICVDNMLENLFNKILQSTKSETVDDLTKFRIKKSATPKMFE